MKNNKKIKKIKKIKNENNISVLNVKIYCRDNTFDIDHAKTTNTIIQRVAASFIMSLLQFVAPTSTTVEAPPPYACVRLVETALNVLTHCA